jgi:hypothetical protein
MNPTRLRSGREVVLLDSRPKAELPPTPADSYGKKGLWQRSEEM